MTKKRKARQPTNRVSVTQHVYITSSTVFANKVSARDYQPSNFILALVLHSRMWGECSFTQHGSLPATKKNSEGRRKQNNHPFFRLPVTHLLKRRKEPVAH